MTKIIGPILWDDEKRGEMIIGETELTFDDSILDYSILVGIRFIQELYRFHL